MNQDKLDVSNRNLSGKVEDAVGKMLGDGALRGEGLIDQAASSAQNVYGDAIELAATALDRASPVIRKGAERALKVTRENSLMSMVVAGAVAYGLAWAFHGAKSKPASH